ncbi:hypothetical protein ACFL13_02160 [Patescibacteria group bacterium]
MAKPTEQELKNKLFKAVFGIIGLVGLGIISITFFGPTVGALFGFISKHRDDSGIEIRAAIPPPIFLSPPTAISEEKVRLEGYAKPGSTIKIYVNGPEKEKTTAGVDGSFIFDDLELIKGRNTLFARAEYKDEESEKSQTLTIVFDDKDPDLDILEPKNGEVVKNLNNRVLVKGKVNEKAEIRINDKLAVQRPDNSFEFLLGVNEGEVNIKVVATDEAGNSDEKFVKVTYKKESP